MFSAYSQISLSLNRKEMNHELNFYIASGSSQTLTKFPGVQELIKGSDPHAYRLGKEHNEARRERLVAFQEDTLCQEFVLEIGKLGRDFLGSIFLRKLRDHKESWLLSCDLRPQSFCN